MMKEDEKKFFRLCYDVGRKSYRNYIDEFYTSPRDVIHILESVGFIHHARCWYLLKKWCDLGFYDYGVTLDLGWFYPDKLPERYKVLLED